MACVRLMAAILFTMGVLAFRPDAAFAATCLGNTVTILDSGMISGTAGDDVILGSNGPDVINGGDGNDVGSGGTGIDSLTGGLGNDSMRGNDGDDISPAMMGMTCSTVTPESMQSAGALELTPAMADRKLMS